MAVLACPFAAPLLREAVVHVFPLRGEGWQARRAFCGLLRAHPREARADERLKPDLAAGTDDWGEDTARQAGFVKRVLDRCLPQP